MANTTNLLTSTSAIQLLDFFLKGDAADIYFASEQLRLDHKVSLVQSNSDNNKYFILDTTAWSMGKDVVRIPVAKTNRSVIDAINELRQRYRSLQNIYLLGAN